MSDLSSSLCFKERTGEPSVATVHILPSDGPVRVSHTPSWHRRSASFLPPLLTHYLDNNLARRLGRGLIVRAVQLPALRGCTKRGSFFLWLPSSRTGQKKRKMASLCHILPSRNSRRCWGGGKCSPRPPSPPDLSSLHGPPLDLLSCLFQFVSGHHSLSPALAEATHGSQQAEKCHANSTLAAFFTPLPPSSPDPLGPPPSALFPFTNRGLAHTSLLQIPRHHNHLSGSCQLTIQLFLPPPPYVTNKLSECSHGTVAGFVLQ